MFLNNCSLFVQRSRAHRHRYGHRPSPASLFSRLCRMLNESLDKAVWCRNPWSQEELEARWSTDDTASLVEHYFCVIRIHTVINSLLYVGRGQPVHSCSGMICFQLLKLGWRWQSWDILVLKTWTVKCWMCFSAQNVSVCTTYNSAWDLVRTYSLVGLHTELERFMHTVHGQLAMNLFLYASPGGFVQGLTVPWP